MKTRFYRNTVVRSAIALVAFATSTSIFTGSALFAQEKGSSQASRPTADTTRTFYLNSTVQQNDANEIMVAIRSITDPSIRIYLLTSQNALAVNAPADQMAIVEKVIKDLDRPRHTYRLTYTIAESDSGKRIGVQHYSVVSIPGQRTILKQGSKVPVMTGVLDGTTSKVSQQIQYLDVGMNFSVTLTTNATGIWLNSKVEQSSIGQEKSGLGEADPVVRQSVLETVTSLALGKASTIGSIDIAGSTRHLDIEVMPELVQ